MKNKTPLINLVFSGTLLVAIFVFQKHDIAFASAPPVEASIPLNKTNPGTTSEDSNSLNIIKFGKSTMRVYHGIKILNLYGSREEMAEAHGFFAKDIVKKNETSLNHFMHAIRNFVKSGNRSDIFKGFLLTVLDRMVYPIFEYWSLSNEEKSVYLAFAKGLGISPSEVYEALLYPDVGQYLSSLGIKKTGFDYFKELPPLGCTTVVVNDDNVAKGKIIGRNLDFPSSGIYEKNAAMVFLHPTENSDHEKPKDQEYLMFTSLGLHTTHTSINASGLVLTLHQLMVQNTSMTGSAILTVTDEIARRAHDIEEAKQIISKHNFTSSWRIIIFSSNENKTIIADVNAKNKSITEFQDQAPLGFTNHAIDSNQKKEQFFPSYKYGWDSLQRYKRLEEMFGVQKSFTTSDVVNMLSDTDLPKSMAQTNDFSAIKNQTSGVISKLSSLMSVIIVPKGKLAYFALPESDYARAGSGQYIPVPIDFSMSWLEENDKNSQSNLKFFHPLKRSHNPHQNQILAEAKLRFANSVLEKSGSWNEAYKLVQEAAALDPLNISSKLMAGLSGLKLYSILDPESGSNSELIRSSIEYLKGRAKFKINKDAYDQELAVAALSRAYLLDGNLATSCQLHRSFKSTTSETLQASMTEDWQQIKIACDENDKIPRLNLTRKNMVPETARDYIIRKLRAMRLLLLETDAPNF